MAVFSNVGGWIADTLVAKGLSVTTVRKIMQSIGFLGPAFFLTQLSHINSPALAVLCRPAVRVLMHFHNQVYILIIKTLDHAILACFWDYQTPQGCLPVSLALR
ncbi:hypothetical protein KSP39_PZI022621 [Platanthera zijinensis]|uniref:Uncharacterized protein n=1 Tax=Platanthera zijinensis TaxID=2320716 RepID=A0AAP0AUD8_9ASPA